MQTIVIYATAQNSRHNLILQTIIKTAEEQVYRPQQISTRLELCTTSDRGINEENMTPAAATTSTTITTSGIVAYNSRDQEVAIF